MTTNTAKLVTPAVTTAAASIAAIDMERTLTQLPFWSSLTEREMDTIRRSAFVRHYEKGAFVHSSDNECLGMLFVLSGEIRTYLLSEEGREVTLFRLYPGELCVLSASCVISQITFDTQMTAGMDTDVLIMEIAMKKLGGILRQMYRMDHNVSVTKKDLKEARNLQFDNTVEPIVFSERAALVDERFVERIIQGESIADCLQAVPAGSTGALESDMGPINFESPAGGATAEDLKILQDQTGQDW